MGQSAETEKSFLTFYDQFAEPIFRHCYFRVSSREVAEDVTQETFLRVWNYLAKGETIDNPKAFLYRIAGNLIIDYYRKKKEMSLDLLSDEGFNPVGDDASTTINFVEGQYALRIIQKLESPYREALIMKYVDNLSIGDIARIVGESENTVSVRIHRAVEKLKKIFHHEKSS